MPHRLALLAQLVDTARGGRARSWSRHRSESDASEGFDVRRMPERGPEVRQMDVQCPAANAKGGLVAIDEVLEGLSREDATLVGSKRDQACVLGGRELDCTACLMDLPGIEVDHHVVKLQPARGG
jgi:hypothetical protein